MLTTQSYKKGEAIAMEVLGQFEINHPPVHVDKIAKKLGLNIVYFTFEDDIAGALVIEKDKGTIGVNPNNSLHRQRFTIAHELGHYIMHRTGNEFFIDKDFLVKWRNSNSSQYSNAEKIQEIEANAFAAAILMPKHLIISEIEKSALKNLPEGELIDELARRFKVSTIAMSYRIANLNNNYF